MTVAKLRRRFGVEVNLKPPRIPYRETITAKVEAHGRHKKQTGGHGQFGDCKITMEPLPRGADFEFVDDIFGGSIPRQFVPAVEKGIQDTRLRGYLAGYPVVDFRVTVTDGSYHDVDSSEMAFKLAGRLAFRDGMTRAKPTMLEPIMNVEVYAPSDFAGDLMGDLNSRRGRIAGMDTRGAATVIRATVPMAEMLTYEQTLTSTTGGRGVVPHGVLALRRGAGPPAREDHRGVEGRARRSEGRGRVGSTSTCEVETEAGRRSVGADVRAGGRRWSLSAAGRCCPRRIRPPPASRRQRRRSRSSWPACEPRRWRKGISQATLDAALAGLEPNPVVVARDRAQPELTQSLDDYVTARLTSDADRRRPGRWPQTHAALLEQSREGVRRRRRRSWSPSGASNRTSAQFTGTLPDDHVARDAGLRRAAAAIFRDELFAALKIVDARPRRAADLKGSWAGAMGQPQFMPSSYLQHAVDFDGDGRIDIWTVAAGRVRLDGQLPQELRLAAPASAGAARCACRRPSWRRSTRASPMRTNGLPRRPRADRRAAAQRVGEAGRDAGRRQRRCRTARRPPRSCAARRATSSSTATTRRSSTTTARTPTPSASGCWRTRFRRVRSQRAEVSASLPSVTGVHPESLVIH